jgi:hypothetical protein
VNKRPRSVTIVGILNLIYGIFGYMSLILLFATTNYSDPHQEAHDFGFDMGIALTVFTPQIFAGITSLKGRWWAWGFSFVLTLIEMVKHFSELGSFSNSLGGGPSSLTPVVGFVGLIIGAILLFHLFRSEVRSYFRRNKI